MDKQDAVSRPYTTQLIEGIKEEGEDNDWRWKRELKGLDTRIEEAVAYLKSKGCKDNGVILCKHMAKHSYLYDLYNDHKTTTTAAAKETEKKDDVIHRHVLLIRDPVAVLSSWGVAGSVHDNNPTPDEVGIVPLLSIHSSLVSNVNNNAHPPVILDSDQLVRNPKHTLTKLCEDLNIDYTDDMLTWESGEHLCDGPWAKWWYDYVHQTTGWEINDNNSNTSKSVPSPSTFKYRTLPPSLLPTLRASLPAYQYLQSLSSTYQSRGPPPSQTYEDPRNEHLLLYVGSAGQPGKILPREIAGVSPFDSSVQGGDATWEGIRIYNGRIFHLNKHLSRLQRSSKALGFKNVHTKEEIIHAIFQILAANGMRNNAHLRLTLTRGEKCTSSMNPKFNVYGTTLIIIPEWKPTEGATTYDNTAGISLITSSTRRNTPSCCDSKIHHNNMINNILPKIQANLAGVADAIMLDLEGYVSETNATNIFMVNEDDVLLTPHADYCLPGITRETVLLLASELGIATEVRRVSLAEFHAAEEVFTTGTMGELTPVTCIDGRVIGSGTRGVITKRLQEAYKDAIKTRLEWSTELPDFS